MHTRLYFLFIVFGVCDTAAQPTGHQETNLTIHPANDRYASFSPDGKLIVFESDRNGSWDIYVMDPDGKNQRALIADSADNRRPSWYPDGQAILFESTRNGTVNFFRYSFQTNTIAPAIEAAVPDGTLQFGRISPNGQHLVFTLQINDTVMHQWLYNFDRKTIQKLTYGNFRYACAGWSPDGKSLLLHARHETNNQTDAIYTFRLKNKRWKRLTRNTEHSFCPAWSNDGKRIAYVQSMANNRPEIIIMNRRGRVIRQVTRNTDGDTLPFWSPDDRQLLITGYRNGNFEICKIHLN